MMSTAHGVQSGDSLKVGCGAAGRTRRGHPEVLGDCGLIGSVCELAVGLTLVGLQSRCTTKCERYLSVFAAPGDTLSPQSAAEGFFLPIVKLF